MWQECKTLFFVEIIYDLLNQNSSKTNAQLPKQRINHCSKTVFLYPVIEYEIDRLSESLKANYPQVMVKFRKIL
jgi:hypothetical protein